MFYQTVKATKGIRYIDVNSNIKLEKQCARVTQYCGKTLFPRCGYLVRLKQ